MENIHDPAGDVSKSPKAVSSTLKLDSVDEPYSNIIQEPVAKGFLGKGKTRIIFYLSLNMATAQIFLMNEDGVSLATLSQSNLLADIKVCRNYNMYCFVLLLFFFAFRLIWDSLVLKVFSSSFSIKAALGNLKISDDTLPGSHSYFWMCDMRNPGGKSFVEVQLNFLLNLFPFFFVMLAC